MQRTIITGGGSGWKSLFAVRLDHGGDARLVLGDVTEIPVDVVRLGRLAQAENRLKVRKVWEWDKKAKDHILELERSQGTYNYVVFNDKDVKILERK